VLNALFKGEISGTEPCPTSEINTCFSVILNILFFLILFRKIHIHGVSEERHSRPAGHSWLASRNEVLLHRLLDRLRASEDGRPSDVRQRQPAQVQQPSREHQGAEGGLSEGGVQPQGGRGCRERARRLGELLP